MSDQYIKRALDAFRDGKINKPIAERLVAASAFGMTDELFNLALEDAESASEMNLEDENHLGLRVFLFNIVGDILKDTFGVNIDKNEKTGLIAYLIDNIAEIDNLTDLRIFIYSWFSKKKDLHKEAYIDMGWQENPIPTYDRVKWINAARDIQKAHNKSGESIDLLAKAVTSDWDSDEARRFKDWLDFYRGGNAGLYKVKNANYKTADLNFPAQFDTENRSNQYIGNPFESVQSAKLERRERAQSIKSKMNSRIRSIKRLLEQYNGLLPHQDIEKIQEELFALEKSVMRLNVQANIKNCIVRTASKIERLGFGSGANELRSLAGEPAPIEVANNKVDVNLIIDSLEKISQELKERDMIRRLASVDILLNKLGMASYFPELTDAQSKLIEAFGYSSNKVESIVAKLRGGGSVKKPLSDVKLQSPPPIQPKQPKQEKIDMDVLQEQPIGNIQKTQPK